MKFLQNIIKNGTRGAIATAGGCGARVIEKKIAPMIPFIKDYPKFHSMLPFLVVAGLADMKGMNDAGIGMMAVAVSRHRWKVCSYVGSVRWNRCR